MDCREFLKVAISLTVGKSRQPAYYRSAIGRAYYAAFHTAGLIFTAINLNPPEGPGSHSQVAQALQESGDTVLKQLGILLNDLHTRRIHADYRLTRTDVETLIAAQAACETAEQIIKGFDTLLADQGRQSKIAPNLQNYLGRLRKQ
jgi:uncharacterized protein (UPF0332 family)